MLLLTTLFISLQSSYMDSSTLTFFSQLVIIRSSLQASASECASFSLTCFFTRSALLQTISTGTLSSAKVAICFIHRAMALNDSRLSTLNMRMMAVADRQKDGVMLLNFYWPAVSQTWARIRRSPTLMTRWPQSRPTVQGMLCRKLPQQNRFRKEVLPTPESPIRIILIIWSQGSSARIRLQTVGRIGLRPTPMVGRIIIVLASIVGCLVERDVTFRVDPNRHV